MEASRARLARPRRAARREETAIRIEVDQTDRPELAAALNAVNRYEGGPELAAALNALPPSRGLSQRHISEGPDGEPRDFNELIEASATFSELFGKAPAPPPAAPSPAPRPCPPSPPVSLLTPLPDALVLHVVESLLVEELSSLGACARRFVAAARCAGRTAAARRLGCDADDLAGARWAAVLAGRRFLPWRPLDAGDFGFRVLPDDAVAWADCYAGYGDGSDVVGSFLLRRRDDDGRIVRDPDGVLAPWHVGPEHVFEGGGSFDPGVFSIALPLCVQVKIAVGSSAPLLVYEWTRPARRSEAVGGFQRGDDWASAIAGSLETKHAVVWDGADFWYGYASPGMALEGGDGARFAVRGRGHRARWRTRGADGAAAVELRLPAAALRNVRWRVDAAASRPVAGPRVVPVELGAMSPASAVFACLGAAPCAFTVAGKRYRAPLRDVWNAALHASRAAAAGCDDALMSMTEFENAPGTLWPTILDCAPQPYRDLLRHDGFASVFPKDARPPKLCVVVGSTGATSSTHADPLAWTGWHLLLCGEKRWRFWGDAEAGFGDAGCSRAAAATADRFGPRGLGAAFVRRDAAALGEPDVEVVQKPGEFLFFPGHRWHAVDHAAGPTLALAGQCLAGLDGVLGHVGRWRGLAKAAGALAAYCDDARALLPVVLALVAAQERAA